MMIFRHRVVAAVLGSFVLFSFVVYANADNKNRVVEVEFHDWPTKFGEVWCPAKKNGGDNFRKVSNYQALPNDPLGDGQNNCYMAAFDTRVFSSNGKPVSGCANLDLSNFPGHTCTEVSTPEQFRMLRSGRKKVAIILNDLVIAEGMEPWLAAGQESLVVLGVYNQKNKRPVLIASGSPGPSSFFSWKVKSPESRLMLINLRLKGSNCILVDDGGLQKTFVGLALTAKCSGRLIMAAFEKETDTNPIDNRFYFKRVMARAKNSHTIYIDRTYLNWVEESLIMGPWIPGKHAAKFTGQNVVIKNSLFTNEGVHGQPVQDMDYQVKSKPWLGKGGLAPISMASCNRAVLDGVTVVNHVVRGNSNPQAIQWQFRDALGAGCDLPRIYRRVDEVPGHDPYYGPAWYEGTLEEPSSAWSSGFWEKPRMLNSYVVRSQIVQTYDKNPGHGRHYALMTDGTYPSVRDSNMSSTRHAAKKIPPGWIERQRIHVSGNCLDNGQAPDALFRNHVLKGMGAKGKHDYDNTEKFVVYGANQCSQKESVDPSVKRGVDSFLDSLPTPVWAEW